MTGAEQMARLQELAAGGAGAPVDVAGLLAEHPDPTVRLLAEMWSRREEDESEGEPAEVPCPVIEALDLDDLGLPPGVPALRRRIEQLELELERLAEINDILAAALGSCPLCWGDDPSCETCGGHGGPGSLRPDRTLFAQLVTPALERLRELRHKPARRSGPPSTHPSPIDDRSTTDERRKA